jgi:hypothetical protein
VRGFGYMLKDPVNDVTPDPMREWVFQDLLA